MKTCRICGSEKEDSEFHVNKSYSDGRDGRCRACKNSAKREYDAREDVKERNREYRSGEVYRSGRARISESRALIRAEKAAKNRERAGDRYLSKDDAKALGYTRYFDGSICKRGHMSHRSVANRMCCQCAIDKASTEKAKARRASYYASNRDAIIAKNIENQRRRYAQSPAYKAATAARNMLKRVLAMTNKEKVNRSAEILGYTSSDLMACIERQFKEGMTWDNYGEWHIDHIKPVSLFLREGEHDPAIINALSNLQPLWADENFAKRDSFDK